MKLQKTSKLLTPVLGALALGICSANAAVSTLTFSNGNGTSNFDQYNGTAGSGWLGAWGTTGNFATINGSASVTNSTPFASGGNYLNAVFANSSGSAQIYRLNRQWDTSAVDFSSGIKIEFDIRSSINLSSSSSQQFFITAATGTTSTSVTDANSWSIGSNGSGWLAWNHTTNGYVSLSGAGAATAGKDFHFTITINPTHTAYDVTVSSVSGTATLTNLALRNKTLAGLSYLNFLGQVQNGQTGGFSVDNISISSVSAVPEPSSFALLAGAAGLGFGVLRRRRRA